MRLVRDQPALDEPRWQPLLEGSLRVQAEHAIGAAAEALAENSSAAGDPTLAQGSAGVALFFSYLAESYDEDRYRDIATQHLRAATSALTQERMDRSLYSGFTGIAWAIEHLRHRLPGTGRDPLGSIDEALLHHLQRSPWSRDYDLISGLVGIGVYGLERLPAVTGELLVTGVLDRLEETAERTDIGITWISLREWVPPQWRSRYPERYYNLGVAHGVPGVVGFLGGVCAAGIETDRVREMLDGAVAWMLAQKLDASSSCLPSWISEEEDAQPARSAWCYGDPGAAATLLVAALGAARSDWAAEAAVIAQQAAARPEAETGVVDATICHGTAGLAHLFNRMQQATSAPALAAASTRWVEKTIALRTHREGIGGFAARVPDDEGKMQWASDPGFLSGAAGSALALLAATTSVEPAWDRLLLASARHERPARDQ